MTDFSADKLRALDEKAMPGPWEAIEVPGHANFSQIVARLPDGLMCVSTDIDDAEGALCAYLRNAVPAILAMAEEREKDHAEINLKAEFIEKTLNDMARMREAGMQLAFAAGALNIATDGMADMDQARRIVLDRLKDWKIALGEEKAS